MKAIKGKSHNRFNYRGVNECYVRRGSEAGGGRASRGRPRGSIAPTLLHSPAPAQWPSPTRVLRPPCIPGGGSRDIFKFLRPPAPLPRRLSFRCFLCNKPEAWDREILIALVLTAHALNKRTDARVLFGVMSERLNCVIYFKLSASVLFKTLIKGFIHVRNSTLISTRRASHNYKTTNTTLTSPIIQVGIVCQI